ncbi:Fc.00g034860.m01.CDS01 [Cosmosporella sp. VM-42]
MDHLPGSRHGIQHISVPFVASFPFDGQDFSTFPLRCGFDRDKFHQFSVDSLASLVQSWLYFGVLDVFFNRHIDLQKFCVEDDKLINQTRVVSSLPLHSLLDQWLESVVIPVLDPPESEDWSQIEPSKIFKYRKTMIDFLEDVLASVETVEELPQSLQAPLPVVLLSAKILVGTLSGVLNEVITLGEDLLTLGYFDRTRRIESNVPLRPDSAGQDQVLPTCQVLLSEFAAQNYCPFIARQICETYNYVAAYYVTRLGITSDISHQRCSSRECVANNVDMTNYTTRHASTDCACAHLSIPVEEVRSIIEAGGIPLVRVEVNGKGETTVRVRRMAGDTPYVAFSHVWSDGLGNPAANSLPICHMKRLQQYVQELRQPRLNLQMGIVNVGAIQWDAMRMTTDIEPRWFWLDTLCIPVGQEYLELKIKAINQMAAIYAGASQALVLDSGMERFSLDQAGTEPCEILARVCTTAWMRRCWTFQEAAITQQCHVRCLERSFDPLEISVGQLSKLQWTHHTDSFIEMMRRSFTMIRWVVRNLRDRDVLVYMRTMPNRNSKDAITSLVSRPFKDVLMDHFQGRRSTTGTYDPHDPETLYQEFVRCWNTLTKRTTTMWDDIHIILANLLDFNAFEILKLRDPAERMKCLLWSMPALPLGLFFNAEGPRHDPGGNHNNRWLPLYPKQNHVAIEPRVHVGTSCIILNGTVEDDKSDDTASRASSEEPPSEHRRVCALSLDGRMAGKPGSKRCVVMEPDGSETAHLSISLLRQMNDTLAASLGVGKSVIVLEKDLTDMSGNAVTRGALFQIMDHALVLNLTTDGESAKSVNNPLDAVFDCPVTVQLSRHSSSASSNVGSEGWDKTIEAKVLDHPWRMEIRCDPPTVAYSLPRRSPRPYPTVLFGFFYLVYLVFWVLDVISVFILIAICRKDFHSFSNFTKTVAVLIFIYDGLTILSLSKLQFLADALFLVWELFPSALAILYLVSRLSTAGLLTRLEYVFVILSLVSNVSQIAWKWSWKWLFLPTIINFWHMTFDPNWLPGGI